MELDRKISDIVNWRNATFSDTQGLEQAINRSYLENRWFDKHHQNLAIEAIKETMLDKNKLKDWANQYGEKLRRTENEKTIALIMAGNIPLVGFHDFISVLISGNIAQVKLSSKDKALWLYLFNKMEEAAPKLFERVQVVERIKDFDAVIATGSNNSARYFEYYFGKYPNIIRKNRNSVAILNGLESDEELLSLGKDIFSYYGLGCRNISHLLVPKGYNFKNMLDLFKEYDWVLDNNKYKNNFDYQLSIMLLNKVDFLQGDAVLLKEDKTLASPISTVHYQFYSNENDISDFLASKQSNIQCIIGAGHLEFGTTQKPELTDYADDIDVLDFLLNLQTEKSTI